MKIASIVDMPDILEIWEESQGEAQVTYDYYKILQGAYIVFLSDSGDSYVSFYCIGEDRYAMHVTSKRKQTRKLHTLILEALEYMFNQEEAETVIGMVKHRGLQLLLSHWIKGGVKVVHLANKERLYVITKESHKEI